MTTGTDEQREAMARELQDLPGVGAVGQFAPGAMGDRVTLYMEEIPDRFDPVSQTGLNAAIWIVNIQTDPVTRDPDGEPWAAHIPVEVHRYPPEPWPDPDD